MIGWAESFDKLRTGSAKPNVYPRCWVPLHLCPTYKFAVRGLAQVMARDLHPQGIHVAYINVDGGIDMPVLRELWPSAKDEDLLNPAATADAFWYLAHQHRSAWSHELDVRPFKEKF